MDTGALPTHELGVGVGVTDTPAVIVNELWDTTKNTLPTAPIRIRAPLVDMFGTVTVAAPSLASLAASTVENVVPPSVDSDLKPGSMVTNPL